MKFKSERFALKDTYTSLFNPLQVLKAFNTSLWSPPLGGSTIPTIIFWLSEYFFATSGSKYSALPEKNSHLSELN